VTHQSLLTMPDALRVREGPAESKVVLGTAEHVVER
jgi:hypothetical protein